MKINKRQWGECKAYCDCGECSVHLLLELNCVASFVWLKGNYYYYWQGVVQGGDCDLWVVQEIELNLEGQGEFRKISRIPWMSPINYSFRTLSSSYLNMSICVSTDISTVILLWCIPLTDHYGYYWHYPFFLVGAPLINRLPTMQIKNSQNFICPWYNQHLDFARVTTWAGTPRPISLTN